MRRPRMRRRPLSELSVNRMLPNVLTVLALCAGMTAIRFAISGDFPYAVFAIIVAGIFDGLDGRLARLLKSTSRFGAELDSLSDFISFGVAPAAVLYLWTMAALHSIGWAIVLFFAVCCALRLARFNTQLAAEPPPWAANFFSGAPAPAGAGLVMLPMFASFEWGDWITRSPYLNAVWITGIALLMVSTIPTVSLKRIRIPHDFVIPTLLGIGVMTAVPHHRAVADPDHCRAGLSGLDPADDPRLGPDAPGRRVASGRAGRASAAALPHSAAAARRDAGAGERMAALTTARLSGEGRRIMTTALSYVHGATNTPLIGETIGVAFDRTVERHGGALALIVRQQGIRWTYRELGGRVDAFAAGLLALGLEPGDRVGDLGAQLRRMGHHPIRHGEGRDDPGQHQPGLPAVGTGVCAQQGRLPGAVTATAFKTSDYIGMVNTLAPELAACAPGQLNAAKLPTLEIVIQIGGPTAPGAFAFDQVLGMGSAAEQERLAELARTLQFDDPINIQFTSGTTGMPKGATLTHHNILNNGFFIGEAMRYTERDRVCIPVPLYHCFGMVIGNLACITHGAAMVFPGEGFDPLATLETVAEERCTSLYGVPTMFIAELEHPRVRRLRSDEPAHRHHGRRALPDRGDAPLHRADAPVRDHDRLWHDRDQPGQHADRGRRSGRASACRRSAACIRMSRSRSSTPTAASCRAARPANSARAAIR